MSLSSATIATAIAALSVSGVTIKNITNTPQQVSARDCPILYPPMNAWKRGGSAQESSNGPATFGTPTTRYWVFNRTYRYIYLHAPVGSGRGLDDHTLAMSDNEDAISTALTALDIPTVDIIGVTVGEFGQIQEPAGAMFYGFTFDVKMRERLNQ